MSIFIQYITNIYCESIHKKESIMVTKETTVNQCACNKEDAAIINSIDKIIDENEIKEGSLIPILQKAQTQLGYLPAYGLKHIAKRLNKPYSEVAGVVGFYSFFTTQPRGKYLVRVCLGTACYVRGGKEVLSELEKHLDIKVGETTEDRLFSLDVGRCFGACGLAPAIMVNDTIHQRVKPARAWEIVEQYRNHEKAKEARQ
jgi:NADH:ubiquinone oxidoreductase subunit E